MKTKDLRSLLQVLACSTAFASAVQATESKNFHIPAGDLASALEALMKQSGAELIYRTEQVKGLRTKGVDGEVSPEQALKELLKGTSLTVHTDSSGAMLITVRANQHDSSIAAPLPEPAPVEAPKEAPPPNPTRAADAAPMDNPAITSGESAADANNAASMGEVIVTGTLIRGVAPVGAQVISLDPQAIAATGASSTDEVLQNIPQLAEFGNTNQQISTVNFQVTVDRPNLRNLPGVGTNGGSTTLVLVDGHRLVGEGLKETAPDPNTVPPALLERVEVIPDGGSSIYGSDAIGGVINFITKRHFDGFQVDARYGFADSFNDAYKTYNVNATAGHDWGSGSAYVAYSYNENSPLLGADRSYVRKYSATGGANPDLTCAPGNVLVTSGAAQTTYAMPGLQPNTANSCDNSRYSSFFGGEIRNSVFAGISQDLNESLKFDLRAYYSNQTQTNLTNLTSAGTIGASNPYYIRTADNPAPLTPNIELSEFSWGPVLGYEGGRLQTTLTSWGATPTVTWDLGNSGWQIREMTNYGGSRTLVQNPEINPTALTAALAGTTTATALDPYDLAATNPAVLADVANYELYGKSKQSLVDERIVGDGSLLPLPGGEAHLAVGAEWMHETYTAKEGNFVPSNEGSDPFTNAARTTYAAFTELNIPIVGARNAMTGIQSLNLDASARYDHYSDFGGTTNPKIALDYKPIDWIKIRGNWGSSFNAPSLADTAAVDNSIFVAPALVYPSVLPGQFSPNQSLWPLVYLQGGLPHLQPQTAHTYEFGTDILPPIVPGMKLSLTYYHITFYDIISTPDVSSPFDFWSHYTNSYMLNPTSAQVNALAAQVPGGAAVVAPYLLPGSLPVYALIDDRRRNLGDAKLSGLDFSLSYSHPTSFGSVDASISGTYALESETQPLPGLPFVDNLEVNNSRDSFVVNTGANVGDLRAQAIFNYVGGFDTTPTPANGEQAHIGSFSVVNLFFRYDLSRVDIRGTGLTKQLALTLNVNNLFSVNPPLYRATYDNIYNGFANGSTVGRLIQFGFSKKL